MIALTLTLALLAPTQEPARPAGAAPDTSFIAYGVGDLTGAAELGAPPFGEIEPGRALEFLGDGWLESWQAWAERLAEVEARAESLANEVRDYVAIDAKNVHVVTPGVLAVVGTVKEHAALAEFLVWQRAMAESVFVEAEVWTTAAGTREELGLGGQALVSAEELDALRQRLSASDAERIQAPKILLGPSSRVGKIQVGEQVAYIRDFDVEHDPATQTTVADPVIDVAFDGLTLEIRVTPLAGESLGASVELRLSKLTRPIATREIEVTPNGPPVTIQEPDIRTTSVRTRVQTLDGETAVLVAPDPEGEGDLVLLLTLSRLEMREAPGIPDDGRR